VIPAHARAVVFDAVGTVIRPAVSAPVVYAQAAARFGLTVSPDAVLAGFLTAFRVEEDVDRRAGWLTSEVREVERWRRIVAAALPGTGDAVFDELYRHFARPDAWAVPADAGPTFAALAERGLRLGLGSNYDSRLDTVLAGRPELAPLAGCVVVSSRVGVRKPGAEFFGRVCAELGCEPGEVVFVGDDVENDILGATAAGMVAVLIDPAGRHPDVRPRVASLSGLLAVTP
jgi:putative hydrolase of the HAD superfamily